MGDLDRDGDCVVWYCFRLAKAIAGYAADGPVFDALGGPVTAKVLSFHEVATDDFDI